MRRSLQMHAETGGITILVVLLLLVLMTVSALAMSKNALREVIISGTSRQGAEVRNLADTGIEWSVYWMANDLDKVRAPATNAALVVANAQDAALSGATVGIPIPISASLEMIPTTNATVTKKFDLSLIYMGKLKPEYSQQGAPGLALMSVRSNASAAYTGGPTFVHSREAWYTVTTKTYQ